MGKANKRSYRRKSRANQRRSMDADMQQPSVRRCILHLAHGAADRCSACVAAFTMLTESAQVIDLTEFECKSTHQRPQYAADFPLPNPFCGGAAKIKSLDPSII